MSSPTIQAIWASKSPFVPRKPGIVTIGHTFVSLYPQVDKNMTDPKKALAYQHNKTALASDDLDQRVRILTLADRLNLMLTAESSLANWERNLLQLGELPLPYNHLLARRKGDSYCLENDCRGFFCSSACPKWQYCGLSFCRCQVCPRPTRVGFCRSSCEGNIISNFPRVLAISSTVLEQTPS